MQAGNVNTRQLQCVVLLNTIHQYMKERRTNTGSVITWQPQKAIFLNIIDRYMKGSTYVVNVNKRQQGTHIDKYN